MFGRWDGGCAVKCVDCAYCRVWYSKVYVDCRRQSVSVSICYPLRTVHNAYAWQRWYVILCFVIHLRIRLWYPIQPTNEQTNDTYNAMARMHGLADRWYLYINNNTITNDTIPICCVLCVCIIIIIMEWWKKIPIFKSMIFYSRLRSLSLNACHTLWVLYFLLAKIIFYWMLLLLPVMLLLIPWSCGGFWLACRSFGTLSTVQPPERNVWHFMVLCHISLSSY